MYECECSRDELLFALLAGWILVVLRTGCGHRVALLLQELLEGIQFVGLLQRREITRLQGVTSVCRHLFPHKLDTCGLRVKGQRLFRGKMVKQGLISKPLLAKSPEWCSAQTVHRGMSTEPGEQLKPSGKLGTEVKVLP